MNVLGEISQEEFLKEYWQKKPLLVRNAFPDFVSPIDPDDMAGLSLIEEVESRIILEDKPNNSWDVKHGPFSDDTFSSLPEQDWTLLVQAVDQWVPEMADILDLFNFIPNWRRDDVMASFAPIGGGVGPHYDNYDVFLIQGLGQRKWQVGPKCSDSDAIVDDVPVKILKEMQVYEEWVLNPGDMLYLPPTFAHNGVALDDCMTFSVGFRAPSESDILVGFSEFIAQQLSQDKRYSDADIKNASDNPALIDVQAISRISQIVQENLSKEGSLEQWIAQYMTECKYEGLHEALEDELDWEDLEPLLTPGEIITHNETSRWAYYKLGDSIHLTINGEALAIEQTKPNQELATTLANQRHTNVSEIQELLSDKDCRILLLTLFNGNHLYFNET